jgi:hypothetical protein
MDFIQFTDELKNDNNKQLIEAVQSGYIALHESYEEKMYHRQDGSPFAKVYIHDLDGVDWEAIIEDAKLLDQSEDVNSFSLVELFTKHIGPQNQYGGSADWGGADLWTFKQGVGEDPGFNGLYLGLFDDGWTVGVRPNGDDVMGADDELLSHGNDDTESLAEVVKDLGEALGKTV